MAKKCSFETYLPNGDPFWYCSKPSTQKVSKDIVNEVNEYWEEIVKVDVKKNLWVVYEDLCDTHAKVVNELYTHKHKAEEVKDDLHVQVGKT